MRVVERDSSSELGELGAIVGFIEGDTEVANADHAQLTNKTNTTLSRDFIEQKPSLA